MFENLTNMVDVVKKVQDNIQDIQQQLRAEKIFSSSGDVLSVCVNGQQELISIEFNERYLVPENNLLLENLLLAAINDAMAKSRSLNQNAMIKLSGELGLPNISGLF